MPFCFHFVSSFYKNQIIFAEAQCSCSVFILGLIFCLNLLETACSTIYSTVQYSLMHLHLYLHYMPYMYSAHFTSFYYGILLMNDFFQKVLFC